MTAMAGMACLAGAGCSGSHGNGATSGGGDPFAGMTAPQVLHAAVDGMTLAPSFILTGGFGQHSGGVDLHLRYLRGQGCAGTIDDGSFGNSVIVVIGETVWTEGDHTFWEQAIGRQLPQLVPPSAAPQTARGVAGWHRAPDMPRPRRADRRPG